MEQLNGAREEGVARRADTPTGEIPSGHRVTAARRPNAVSMGVDEIGELLGTGVSGAVHRCVHRATREEWAVKIVKLPRSLGGGANANATSPIEAALSEARMLASIRHPGIVHVEVGVGARARSRERAARRGVLSSSRGGGGGSSLGRATRRSATTVEVVDARRAPRMSSRDERHDLSTVMRTRAARAEDVFKSGGGGGDQLFIVMELVTGGDLFDRVVERSRYPEVVPGAFDGYSQLLRGDIRTTGWTSRGSAVMRSCASRHVIFLAAQP